MSYRGDDLDLRLPQGHTTRPAEPLRDIDRSANGARYRVKARGGQSHERAAPLWVDDTVLAVCNAAHEVAEALHSPEVLLQHLVHGMTRVPAAATALDVYNVDREALRRDVTALISSTAARMPGSTDVPLTSSEFKAALRLAGEVASRRGGEAITAEDLLEVLMNYDTDHPGIELLLSHIREQAAPVPPVPPVYLPTYQRSAPAPEQSYIRAEPLYSGERAEYRPPAYRPPIERVVVREVPAPVEIEPHLRAMEDRVVSQLSALEANFRSELRGFETERRAMAELVQQLHADVTAHRTETVGLRDSIGEKIERISSSVRGGADNTAPIMARLQGLERMFEGRLGDVSKRSLTLDERMKSVESAIAHQSRETADIKETLSDEISVLSGLMQKNAGVENTDFEDMFGERLDTIETLLLDKTSESGGGLDEDAVEHIDRLLAKHHKLITDSMHERERNWSAVNERLNKMEHILTSQAEFVRDSSTDRKRLIEAMNERMSRMERLVEKQAQTAANSFSSVEKVLRENKGNGGAGAEHLVEIKGMLGRVSNAQQTTAEVFDQWRADLSGDLSILNNRMEQLERVSARPIPMLDSISSELRNLHAATTEKIRIPKIQKPEGMWDAFSNWLFGPR